MSVETMLRLGLLYAHLILCAFAICYVLSADLQILKGSLSRAEMRKTAHRMTILLCALWATGLPIVWIDLAGNIMALGTKPKLAAKLLCVFVLSLNALVLHKYAFPKLMSVRSLSNADWRLVMCFGSLSTTSWLFAAFLGIAKPLANVLSFSEFVSLYALVASAGVIVSLLAANALRRRISQPGAGAMA